MFAYFVNQSSVINFFNPKKRHFSIISFVYDFGLLIFDYVRRFHMSKMI
jgi:hypothetical protein